ncbi:uncharacterized protein ATC70_012613 [Mucor velutinosus]|uniref:Uncharacterized protein n=1 Tax=Mucor velutinosus TaxID=708070 RepID=A0AAN7D5T2_9FUNG|nr:hypothetical protein ATC70_012613 [Mucor velutinosus]
MNAKLLIALAAVLALAQVDAQGVPALSSLSSKIDSISSTVSGNTRTPLLSSASSAHSRVSAGIASSAIRGSSTQAGAISSQSASASMASSSAASAQSSVSNAHSSLASSAAASQSTASNAANPLVGGSNYLLQLSALAAVFIASFVAILA